MFCFLTPQFAHFFLPQNATSQSHSSCGEGNTSHPILALSFGAGHLLSLNFSKTLDKYQVEELTFHYNLSDETLFPNASEGKMKTSCSYYVTLADVILICFHKNCYIQMPCDLFTGKVMEVTQKSVIQARIGTEYRCINSKYIYIRHVNITFSNVTLEAYPTNGTFSTNSRYLVTENVLGGLVFPIIDVTFES